MFTSPAREPVERERDRERDREIERERGEDTHVRGTVVEPTVSHVHISC